MVFKILKKRRVISSLAVLAVFFLSGCGTLRQAVPENLQSKAYIPGMEETRAFASDENEYIAKDLVESFRQESSSEFPEGPGGVTAYPILLVSGGAANGAYGAGLLKGWSKSGTRPKFKVVTGVSVGGLIAPYAFLGQDYDDMLESIFTNISTKNVMRKKGLMAVLFSDSLASNKPLYKVIRDHLTKDVIEKIAEEHKKGRRLYVGTANVDAQKLVIWNMGKIASIGGERSIDLFCDVLLASAAIPVAFPPVFFDVEVDDKSYNEMHVDGSIVAQTFFIYGVLDEVKKNAIKQGAGKKSKGKGKLYVIRNGYVSPSWQETKDSLASIAGRSLDTFINTQGVGDLYRLYTIAKIKGNEFNLAYIPGDHVSVAKEMFDEKEMKALFDLGYEQAVNGYPWANVPPGLEEITK